MSEENNANTPSNPPEPSTESNLPPIPQGDDLPPPPPAPEAAPPPPVTAATATGVIDGGMSDKTWAMIAHLSGALWIVSIPGIIGALIVYLVKKDTMPFVNQEGKEAVNFQISNLIYMVGAVIIMFVSCGFGFFVPIIVALFSLIFSIIAGLKANEGVGYRYPLNIRFIK